MPIRSSFVLYGATGYAGALIARRSAERGLTPILAGRNREKLRALGHELGLNFVVAPLDEPAELEALFEHTDVLLNAAGPFAITAPVLQDLALSSRVHYLDLSGEVATMEYAASMHGVAQANRVMLMPGVGFDVVASDCLAVHVTRGLGRVDELSLALFGIGPPSRGSAVTMADQAGRAVSIRRHGRMVSLQPGAGERLFRLGDETIAAVPVSWGDLVTAHVSTGAPNITVYFEATPALRFALAASRASRMLGFSSFGAELVRFGAAAMPAEPAQAAGSVRILAEATGERGSRRSLLWTPNVYAITADAAVAVIRRVLSGDVERGFQTPGRVYGPDFVLSLAHVRRADAAS